MKTARRGAAVIAIALAVGIFPVELAGAAGETRSLKLYFIHTGEKATITFKRNGKFDPKGLQEINRFLRDWRRNEPTKMDPRLFDLVWEVYNKVGATDYIHVVSAYRSPATNAMLRSRTKGVAETSQHMRGKAMDFYIPGVSLKALREAAVQYQRGGVGFYPNSRSPFVHLDVAGVRAWPRMPRADLARLFPDGKTLHIPADGKPLPGYDQALAEYKARADMPLEIAEAGSDKPKRRNLLAFLFGGGDEDEDADAIAAPPAPADGQQPVAVAEVTAEKPTVAVAVAEVTAEKPTVAAALNAPVPANRPALAPPESPAPQGTLMSALTPPPPGTAPNAALQAVQQEAQQQQPAFADLNGYRIPVPTLLPRGETPETPASELAFIPVPLRRPGNTPASEAPAQPTAAPLPAAESSRPTADAPVPAAAAAPQVASVRTPPGNAFSPSASLMMGEAEPMRPPAALRLEATRTPSSPPAIQPSPAAVEAKVEPTPVKVAKAGRVSPAPAPTREEPRPVPVRGFDPNRF